MDVAEVKACAAGLAEVHARIAPRFARVDPRERVLAYVRGLLAPLEGELLDPGRAGRRRDPAEAAGGG